MRFILLQKENQYFLKELIEELTVIENRQSINVFEYHSDDEDYILKLFDKFIDNDDLITLLSSYYGLTLSLHNLHNFLIEILPLGKIKFCMKHKSQGFNSCFLIYWIEVIFENNTDYVLWELKK
jgi:hypothetical protein